MRTTIGPYRVIDFIGAGGMGEVYRVVHRTIGRVAAAKILTAAGPSPSAAERFRNEARIHSTVQHPRIATMYEYLEVDGLPCIVMELVEGVTLEQYIHQRGCLPAREALRFLAEIADAVSYLHLRGIVHRDLKSNNVKIDPSGAVKLLDFGIAKAHDSPKLTTEGSVIGTLHYLSPEQLRTGRADARSDLWALGVMLYEMVTGGLPFDGGAWGEIAGRVMQADYRAPSEIVRSVPREVDRIIARCLAAKPENRYASAEALLTDVRASLTGERAAPAPLALRARISGEWVQAHRQQIPLAASVGAAGVALLFFLWAVWPRANVVGPSGESTSVHVVPAPGPTPGPVAAAESLRASVRDTAVSNIPVPPPPVTPAESANLRTVVIRVLGDEAEVYRNGAPVGRTPYTLRAALGTELSLTLRRPGYEDEPVVLRVAEGMSEFIQSMKPLRRP